VDSPDVSPSLRQVKQALRRFGLLPFSDTRTPSLVSIVAGGPLHGSWWGHPAGQAIYQTGQALESDPDVLVIRLWKGKQTLVHRALWPPVERIGRARAPWQVNGLSKAGRMLLARLDRQEAAPSGSGSPGADSEWDDQHAAVRELGDRLLVLTRSVHTSRGAHELEAESWADWRSRAEFARYRGTLGSAQLRLERAAVRLEPDMDPHRLFPWGRKPPR